MQRLRLIPQFAVWLVELATAIVGVGGLVVCFIEFFVKGDADGFMNGLLILPLMALVFYLVTIVVIFVCYLLNFLTGFDDFDGFGEMFESLPLAPIYLIRNVFVHPVVMIRLLFTGEID